MAGWPARPLPTTVVAMSGSVVVVTGASGGVGASSVAAAVAAGLAREARSSVLVDLDLTGGGLDVTCGVEHAGGFRWPDLAGVRGRVSPDQLITSLPTRQGCAVLAAGPSRLAPGLPPPGTEAVGDVLASLAEGSTRVVVDLPRWAVGRWATPVDPWLLVTGTRTRELADLDALVAALEAGPARESLSRCLVVTAGAMPAPGLVGAIEDHLGITHIGHVERAAGVAGAAERGEWPSHRAFRSVVRAVLDWTWRRSAA